MKLLVIGCGQCGGRIADAFARLNVKARIKRGMDIIANTIAVNTDVADLSGLSFIKPDSNHRVLIGGQKTGGHGVGKLNELGAEIIKEDSDVVLEAVRMTQYLHEADAFLLVAGAAGGTGSGVISLLTRYLKEHYADKPLYNLIVLPFKHEEKIEERAVYNTATCLKSAYLVADAVFLVDNQRYISKDSSIQANLARVNAMIVEPFYNLLCAGEETKSQYIGSKVLDAGDIIQTLSGWTILGYGRSKLPFFRVFSTKSNFRDKNRESHRGMKAMNDAIGELSLKCDPSNARRALYLLTTEPREMSMSLFDQMGHSLKSVATDAIIRSGDYPRGKGELDITLILSDLVNVRKVAECFTKALNFISSRKRWGDLKYKHGVIEEALGDIPSLL